jgi:hypothetical protein
MGCGFGEVRREGPSGVTSVMQLFLQSQQFCVSPSLQASKHLLNLVYAFLAPGA